MNSNQKLYKVFSLFLIFALSIPFCCCFNAFASSTPATNLYQSKFSSPQNIVPLAHSCCSENKQQDQAPTSNSNDCSCKTSIFSHFMDSNSFKHLRIDNQLSCQSTTDKNQLIKRIQFFSKTRNSYTNQAPPSSIYKDNSVYQI